MAPSLAGVWILRNTPTGAEHLQILRSPGRYHSGIWSLCRGGIEPGETAHAAALRELTEETSLPPAEFFSLGMVEQFYTPESARIWLCPFFLAVVPADAEVKLNEEHTAYRWVPDATIESLLCWPSEFAILREVRRFYLGGHPTLSLMRLLPESTAGER